MAIHVHRGTYWCFRPAAPTNHTTPLGASRDRITLYPSAHMQKYHLI